jgi:protein phosphatase
MLTRVLGVFPEVDVDLWEVVPFAGDRILLCSDGLCRELTDDQIASVLRRLADPDEAARELISRARASGGADNVTVVIIDVVDDDGRARTASAALAGDVAGAAAAPGSGARSGVEGAHEIGPPTELRPPSDAAATSDAGGADTGDADTGDADTAVAGAARRRLTLRVVGFLLLLGLLLGGASTAVWYYARESFYVGLGPVATTTPKAPAPIVIYRGRPGGLLWFEPTVHARTRLTTADVLSFRVPDLRAGKIEPSVKAAQAYLHNLTREKAALQSASAPQTLPTLPPPPAGATTLR